MNKENILRTLVEFKFKDLVFYSETTKNFINICTGLPWDPMTNPKDAVDILVELDLDVVWYDHFVCVQDTWVDFGQPGEPGKATAFCQAVCTAAAIVLLDEGYDDAHGTDV